MSSLGRWILGTAIAVLIVLNSATFGYVVSIERRLTRLETIDELVRPRPRQSSPAGLEARLARDQAVDDRGE